MTVGGSIAMNNIAGLSAQVEDLKIIRNMTEDSWGGEIGAMSLSIGNIFSVGTSDVSFNRDKLEFNTFSYSCIRGINNDGESEDSLKVSKMLPDTKSSIFGFMGFFKNYIMKPRHILLDREKGFSITELEEEEKEGEELKTSLPFLSGKIKLSEIEKGNVKIDAKYPERFDINAKYPIDGSLSFSPSIPLVEYGIFSLYIGGTFYAGIAVMGSYKTSLDKQRNLVCLSSDGVGGQFKAGARLILGIRLGVGGVAAIKGEGFAEASTKGELEIGRDGGYYP